MTIGCFYAGLFGLPEYQIARLGVQRSVENVSIEKRNDFVFVFRFSFLDSFLNPFEILDELQIPGFITYFIFVAAYTIGYLLLGLVLWHGRMIGQGVTSLERFLNSEYARQSAEQGFIFVNPFDFGFRENWRRFFGISSWKQFFTRILLPSRHKPEGNGVTWDGYNVNTNLQTYRSGPLPPTRFRSIVPPWENVRHPTPSNEQKKDS